MENHTLHKKIAYLICAFMIIKMQITIIQQQDEIDKIVHNYKHKNIKKYVLIDYSFTDKERELFSSTFLKEPTDNNILIENLNYYGNIDVLEQNTLQSIRMKQIARLYEFKHELVFADTQSLVLSVDETDKVGKLYGNIMFSSESPFKIQIPNFNSSSNKMISKGIYLNNNCITFYHNCREISCSVGYINIQFDLED